MVTFFKRTAYWFNLAHWQTASLARIGIILQKRKTIMKITQVLGKIYTYICIYSGCQKNVYTF